MRPSSRWRQGINRYLLPVGFLCLILLPSLFFGHAGKEDKALRENRQMAEFPGASMFFFQRLENWYTDHFGGRATLIYYGARWQMDWIGLPSNRNVVVGKDEWLFYDQFYRPGQALFADFRGKVNFSDEQLKRILENLQETQRALAVCGIKFYLVMPPDKQSIYPDKMPFSRASETRTRADQLFAALHANPSLRSVDLRPVIQSARQTETLPLYLKTDTHWNSLGAYYGVHALMQAMKSDGLPVHDAIDRKAYKLESTPHPGGDIAVSLLSLPGYFTDTKIRMTLSHDTAEQIDKERQHYRNPKQQGRLLVYGDSFSEQMLPFLAQRFGEVTGVRQARIDGHDFQTSHPNIVVLEVLERLLAGLEAPPVNLAGLCPSSN